MHATTNIHRYAIAAVLVSVLMATPRLRAQTTVSDVVTAIEQAHSAKEVFGYHIRTEAAWVQGDQSHHMTKEEAFYYRKGKILVDHGEAGKILLADGTSIKVDAPNRNIIVEAHEEASPVKLFTDAFSAPGVHPVLQTAGDEYIISWRIDSTYQAEVFFHISATTHQILHYEMTMSSTDPQTGMRLQQNTVVTYTPIAASDISPALFNQHYVTITDESIKPQPTYSDYDVYNLLF